jgi:hypothetical protein
MWSSRDVAYVVIFAVLSVVNLALVVQNFALLIAIPGIAYMVDILGAIFGSVAFLLYRGKRWRIFMQGILVALLTLPLYLGPGFTPGNIIQRMPTIIKTLLVDLIFISLYASFERRKKLYYLNILQLIFFFSVGPFIDMLFYSLYVPFEFLWPTYYFVLLMLPLIIALTVIGGSIGYKIYERVDKITAI